MSVLTITPDLLLYFSGIEKIMKTTSCIDENLMVVVFILIPTGQIHKQKLVKTLLNSDYPFNVLIWEVGTKGLQWRNSVTDILRERERRRGVGVVINPNENFPSTFTRSHHRVETLES